MNEIVLKSKNQELMQKILWIIEHFKDDGIEISYKEDDINIDTSLCLETLKLINEKDFSTISSIKDLNSYFNSLES